MMKLNYKKTIFVGFAFFLICAFWQAYDSIVPMMLVNKFGLSQTLSGVIMSLDNVIAIFLLPLFGTAVEDRASLFVKVNRRREIRLAEFLQQRLLHQIDILKQSETFGQLGLHALVVA